MISKKKQKQLYDSVHEDIMKARIEIYGILRGKEGQDEVDGVFSILCYTAPANAITIFNSKP